MLLFALLTRPLQILHHPKSRRSAWPVWALPEQESHPDHQGPPHPLQCFKTPHFKLSVAILNISFAATHLNWTDGTAAHPPTSRQRKHLWSTVLPFLNASSFKTAHLESPVGFKIFVWKRRILITYKYFVCILAVLSFVLMKLSSTTSPWSQCLAVHRKLLSLLHKCFCQLMTVSIYCTYIQTCSTTHCCFEGKGWSHQILIFLLFIHFTFW